VFVFGGVDVFAEFIGGFPELFFNGFHRRAFRYWGGLC
jgi:hypothetical protein